MQYAQQKVTPETIYDIVLRGYNYRSIVLRNYNLGCILQIYFNLSGYDTKLVQDNELFRLDEGYKDSLNTFSAGNSTDVIDFNFKFNRIAFNDAFNKHLNNIMLNEPKNNLLYNLYLWGTNDDNY